MITAYWAQNGIRRPATDVNWQFTVSSNGLQRRHMNIIVFQITDHLSRCSTICSGQHQRNIIAPLLLALCKGNSPVTGEFPTQRANNAENASIWWRHNEVPVVVTVTAAMEEVVVVVMVVVISVVVVVVQVDIRVVVQIVVAVIVGIMVMVVTTAVAMMTSSNGNIFRVTGPLWGESIGHRWIPITKASDAELYFF